MSKSTFTRGWTVVVAVVLLAVTACKPSPEPTQHPTPKTAVSATAIVLPTATVPATPTVLPTATVPATTPGPTPDWSRLVSDELTSPDPDAANRAMREFTDWARDASGLRAQLGAQADEIFRLADQAKAVALQDILRQLQSNGKSGGMAALLPPPSNRSIELGQFISYVEIPALLVSSMWDIKRHRGGDAEPRVTESEVGKEIGEGVHGYVKMKTKLVGSRVEADVEMTIRVEKDGKTIEEKGSGKLSANVCPDEQGIVPLDMSFQSGASSDGGSFNMGFSVQGIGHVDDEGNLASVEEEIQVEMSIGIVDGGTNGTVRNLHAQVNLRSIVKGLASDKGASREVSYPGRTFLGIPFFTDFEVKATEFVGSLAMLAERQGFDSARKEWQGGTCVAIVVPEYDRHVRTGSETSFTASVQHKFEGADLTVPVVATLDSGAVSVTPSNTKVPAPATFIYKAPDEMPDDTGEAWVKLVSKSRRGIGELDVGFEIFREYYTVDGFYGDCPYISLSGNICALDKPFTLTTNGQDQSEGKYAGEITFTPTGMSGGSWKYAATLCANAGGCGTISSSGTYRVEGVADDEPVIIMDPTTETITAAGISRSFDTAGWQIKPEPTIGDCSAD